MVSNYDTDRYANRGPTRRLFVSNKHARLLRSDRQIARLPLAHRPSPTSNKTT